jgi:hypothetical protein
MKLTFPLFAALLLACTFAAASRAAFGVAILPATVTSSAVTLNGVDQTTTFSTTITVSGVTTNAGWNVTAWAPLPTVGGNTLGALAVTAQPTLGACSGGGCSLPTPTGITWPVTLGTTAGTAVKIYNAAANTGKQTNTLTVVFGMRVLASALPGSYTTTLTIIGSNAGP